MIYRINGKLIIINASDFNSDKELYSNLINTITLRTTNKIITYNDDNNISKILNIINN
jgi:hypothetical protein